MTDKLARAVSGSRLVEYDEETELVYAWNGSLTVNIYSLDGDALDVFTFGGSSGKNVTVEYAEQQIQERMNIDRGEACVYCYAEIPNNELSQVPDEDNDDDWNTLAESHETGCEWILTRAHRRSIVHAGRRR